MLNRKVVQGSAREFMSMVDMLPIPFTHMAKVRGQRINLANPEDMKWTAVSMEDSQIIRLDFNYPLPLLPNTHETAIAQNNSRPC